MKRIIFSFVAFVLLSSPVAYAANSDSMNLRFGPIGLIIGALSLNMDIAIAPNWTIGPEINYWNIKFTSTTADGSDFEIKALSYGGRANWFSNGNYTDGFYIGPFLRQAETKMTLGESSASVSTLVAGSLFGYGWFWDSFNMMLGGGFAAGLGDAKVKLTDSLGATTEREVVTGLSAEYTLGWTF